MHGVIGLPHCEEQDWHRDAPLLFPDCPAFGAESVHARAGTPILPQPKMPEESVLSTALAGWSLACVVPMRSASDLSK